MHANIGITSTLSSNVCLGQRIVPCLAQPHAHDRQVSALRWVTSSDDLPSFTFILARKYYNRRVSCCQEAQRHPYVLSDPVCRQGGSSCCGSGERHECGQRLPQSSGPSGWRREAGVLATAFPGWAAASDFTAGNITTGGGKDMSLASRSPMLVDLTATGHQHANTSRKASSSSSSRSSKSCTLDIRISSYVEKYLISSSDMRVGFHK